MNNEQEIHHDDVDGTDHIKEDEYCSGSHAKYGNWMVTELHASGI